jgi:hypothetical protein
MYVLIYTEDEVPCFIQGTLPQINAEFRKLWEGGAIDKKDWDAYSNWKMLGIEDGELTELSNVEWALVPQFEAH